MSETTAPCPQLFHPGPKLEKIELFPESLREQLHAPIVSLLSSIVPMATAVRQLADENHFQSPREKSAARATIRRYYRECRTIALGIKRTIKAAGYKCELIVPPTLAQQQARSLRARIRRQRLEQEREQERERDAQEAVLDGATTAEMGEFFGLLREIATRNNLDLSLPPPPTHVFKWAIPAAVSMQPRRVSRRRRRPMRPRSCLMPLSTALC